MKVTFWQMPEPEEEARSVHALAAAAQSAALGDMMKRVTPSPTCSLRMNGKAKRNPVKAN